MITIETRIMQNGMKPVPVIVEIDSTIQFEQLTNEVRRITGKNLQIADSIQMPSLGLYFFSSMLNLETFNALKGLMGVKAINYDYDMFTVGIIDRVRDLQVRGYVPKNGQLTTYEMRKYLGVEEANSKGITGKNVKCCVIDTGWSRCPQLPFRSVRGYSTLIGQGGDIDESGHGTHVISTICGRKIEIHPGVFLEGGCPDVDMTSIRCLFTPMGMGSASKTLKAMKIAIDLGCKVINMSLGSNTPSEPDDPCRKVITEASRNGVIFVIAAGNSGPGAETVNSPGDIEDALTVGSWSIKSNDVAWFSSRGPTVDGRIKPDVCGTGGGLSSEDLKPQETILSSSSGLLDLYDMRNGYAALMGTSQATPWVVVIVCLWIQRFKEVTGKDMTVYDVKEILRVHNSSKSNNSGYGLIKYGLINEYLK